MVNLTICHPDLFNLYIYVYFLWKIHNSSGHDSVFLVFNRGPDTHYIFNVLFTISNGWNGEKCDGIEITQNMSNSELLHFFQCRIQKKKSFVCSPETFSLFQQCIRSCGLPISEVSREIQDKNHSLHHLGQLGKTPLTFSPCPYFSSWEFLYLKQLILSISTLLRSVLSLLNCISIKLQNPVSVLLSSTELWRSPLIFSLKPN